ncbi:MAG: histidine triad nucleotide-binding protein [Nitrospinota bacterium]
MDNCIFCKIVKKEIRATILYEDEKIIAFNDINPQAPIHVLAIPKKHVANIHELVGHERPLLTGGLIEVLGQVASDLKIDKLGFRIVLNSGPDGGQEVQHLHCHLLAKRQMRWPPG